MSGAKNTAMATKNRSPKKKSSSMRIGVYARGKIRTRGSEILHVDDAGDGFEGAFDLRRDGEGVSERDLDFTALVSLEDEPHRRLAAIGETLADRVDRLGVANEDG